MPLHLHIFSQFTLFTRVPVIIDLNVSTAIVGHFDGLFTDNRSPMVYHDMRLDLDDLTAAVIVMADIINI